MIKQQPLIRKQYRSAKETTSRQNLQKLKLPIVVCTTCLKNLLQAGKTTATYLLGDKDLLTASTLPECNWSSLSTRPPSLPTMTYCVFLSLPARSRSRRDITTMRATQNTTEPGATSTTTSTAIAATRGMQAATLLNKKIRP